MSTEYNEVKFWKTISLHAKWMRKQGKCRVSGAKISVANSIAVANSTWQRQQKYSFAARESDMRWDTNLAKRCGFLYHFRTVESAL